MLMAILRSRGDGTLRRKGNGTALRRSGGAIDCPQCRTAQRGGGTRHDLFLAHWQFLGEFEGMLRALPAHLIVAAAAAGSGIR